MSEFSRDDLPSWFSNQYWLIVWDEEWQDQEQWKWEQNAARERRYWEEKAPKGFVN